MSRNLKKPHYSWCGGSLSAKNSTTRKEFSCISIHKNIYSLCIIIHNMKTIVQGAEAIISLSGLKIIKNRVKKSYRFPILDQRLRIQRTKKEAKLLKMSSKIIPIPKILTLYKDKDTSLELEFIEGKKLSQHLDSIGNAVDVCNQVGKNIAKLHDANIIHGDLTTSNMILKKNTAYFIDFGLGFESSRAEDKAVDLHVFKEALYAKHFNHAKKFWAAVLQGYKKQSPHASIVLKRLETVEKRGRYKRNY